MVGRRRMPFRFIMQFTRTLGCWMMVEASGIKSFSEADGTVYEACISNVASSGGPLKVIVLPSLIMKSLRITS